MKTTVSVDDDLYRRADAAAADRGLNRSQFYAEALRAYLQELEDDVVTQDLNAALDAIDVDHDDVAAWTDAAARTNFTARP